MLSKFNNEVLVYGPAAVLPQSLKTEWLTELQRRADDFLDANFDLDECLEPKGPADPLLAACVIEILNYLQKNPEEMSKQSFLEKITVYSLALTMETADRESNLNFESPNLDNILSWERISRFRHQNQEFVEVLEEACIMRNPKQSWLTEIKDRFLRFASAQ